MRNSTFRICTFSDAEGVYLAFLTSLRHLPAACVPIADGLFFTECCLREILRHLFSPKSCLFGAKGDKKTGESPAVGGFLLLLYARLRICFFEIPIEVFYV